jgi:hypothetical protein
MSSDFSASFNHHHHHLHVLSSDFQILLGELAASALEDLEKRHASVIDDSRV